MRHITAVANEQTSLRNFMFKRRGCRWRVLDPLNESLTDKILLVNYWLVESPYNPFVARNQTCFVVER